MEVSNTDRAIILEQNNCNFDRGKPQSRYPYIKGAKIPLDMTWPRRIMYGNKADSTLSYYYTYLCELHFPTGILSSWPYVQ